MQFPCSTNTLFSSPADSFGAMRLKIFSAAIGYMGYGAAQWCILIALARFTSREVVGQFSLAFAVTAPVFLAFDMQLRRIVASDTKRCFSPLPIIRARIGGCLLSIAIIFAISIFTSNSTSQRTLTLLVAFAKSFESTSDLCYGYFQRIERMHMIAASLWLRGLGALITVSVVLWTTRSVIYATAALATVWLVTLLFFDAPQAFELMFPDGWRHAVLERSQSWLTLARVAGPLGVALVLASLGQNIPRYVIESVRGHAELGIYSAASYFFLIGARLAMAVADTILPRLSARATVDQKGFRRILRHAIFPIALSSSAMTLAAVPLAKPLLTLVYGHAYAGASTTVIVILIASGLHCVGCILQSALIALGKLNVQIWIYGGGALTAFCFSRALVIEFGSVGAASGLAAGIAFQGIASALVIFKETLTQDPPETLVCTTYDNGLNIADHTEIAARLKRQDHSSPDSMRSQSLRLQ